MMTDYSVPKNKLSSEQKRLLKLLLLFLQKSQTRVEGIDLSTKQLYTWKRTTDKRIFISFYFKYKKWKKPKQTIGVFWQLTLTLCVIHSRPYWYTLLAAELRAFWMTWASGSQLGGILKKENKVNCCILFYIVYILYITPTSLHPKHIAH